MFNSYKVPNNVLEFIKPFSPSAWIGYCQESKGKYVSKVKHRRKIQVEESGAVNHVNTAEPERFQSCGAIWNKMTPTYPV